MPRLATELLKRIDDKIRADQGALFRRLLSKSILEVGDAFRGEDDGQRGHMGASQIGRACERELWYKFRWVQKNYADPRMLRLWNRGHMEEARFIALVRMAGVEFTNQGPDGRQFRLHQHEGHGGGSVDGVGTNWPDLPPDVRALGEFKTHKDKSFDRLVAVGMREAKWEHYVQMNCYMAAPEIDTPYGIYMAVNKDNDELYAEIVERDMMTANRYTDRALKLILTRTPPKRIGNISWYQCQFCDEHSICHKRAPIAENCRTCEFSGPGRGGKWYCQRDNTEIHPQLAPLGCRQYSMIPGMYD